MNNFSHIAIQNAMCFLLTASLLFSCRHMEPFEAEEINQLFANAVSDAQNCHTDCIEPGTGKYFKKRGFQSERSGINTKVVFYTAYNTEDAFIVEVDYKITTGPARGKASISVNIDGVKKEFRDVPSGRTVSHSIPLPDGWKGCDEVGFQISQTGMGNPIHINHKYELIPVCREEEQIEPVVMGNQIWSKYNLNADRYRNGDPIPNFQDAGAESTGSYSYYLNNPANEEAYGRLYNFSAVTDPRNLAPEGWRIPTEDDWNELLDYLGTNFGEEDYREKLKDFISFIGPFPPHGQPAITTSPIRHWWSSTPHSEDRAKTYILNNERYSGLLIRNSHSPFTSRLSVRLIKE